MWTNNTKSPISLPEVNHIDNTIYSFANGDGVEAGFNLELGVGEASKELGMLRESNVEMPKEVGSVNYKVEERASKQKTWAVSETNN